MEQIGPYQVLEEIGRGGMATVYKVRTPRGDIAALKLLHYGSQQDPRWGTRFHREFRLLSRLRHPHLIEVHDYGEDRDQTYYVMDYIDGLTLWSFYRDHLRGSPTMERLRWILPVAGQIVSALDYIHRHRVVHQDLKPANVLLQKDAQVAYLADFGLAREVKKGTFQYTHAGFIGTLGYAAPEIVERSRMDGRADIYSFGVILYTLLADRRPIQVEGRSLEQLVHAVLHEEPIPIQQLVEDIPPALAQLIHHCIPKDPEKRYRNTRDLWKDLLPLITTYQQQGVIHAPVPELPREAARPQEALLYESGVIGRKEELEQCRERLTQLTQHSSNAISIFYGIPGIGKSFLLEEMARYARRYCSRVYTYRLRQRATPYSTLSRLLQPILREHEPRQYMSANYHVLATYLPDLPVPAPLTLTSLPTLLDPITDLAERIFDLLQQLFSSEGQVWIIDDFHNADKISQEILRYLLLKQLSHKDQPLYVIASIRYTPGGTSPSFQLPERTGIDSTHLLPFLEEEECLYLEQLLGRPPLPHEYEQIRRVSRGIPQRTYELIHHNSLLQQIQDPTIHGVRIPDLHVPAQTSDAREDVRLGPANPSLFSTQAVALENTRISLQESGAFERKPATPPPIGPLLANAENTALSPIISELLTISSVLRGSEDPSFTAKEVPLVGRSAPAQTLEELVIVGQLTPPPSEKGTLVTGSPEHTASQGKVMEETNPELALYSPEAILTVALQNHLPAKSNLLRPPSEQTAPTQADLDDEDSDGSGDATVLGMTVSHLPPPPDPTSASGLPLVSSVPASTNRWTEEGEATTNAPSPLWKNKANEPEQVSDTAVDEEAEATIFGSAPPSLDMLRPPSGNDTQMQRSPFDKAAVATKRQQVQGLSTTVMSGTDKPAAREAAEEELEVIYLDEVMEDEEGAEAGDATMAQPLATMNLSLLEAKGEATMLSVRQDTSDGPTAFFSSADFAQALAQTRVQTPPAQTRAQATTAQTNAQTLPAQTRVQVPTAQTNTQARVQANKDRTGHQEQAPAQQTQSPQELPPSQNPAYKTTPESSQELVMIPLLQRRLEMMGPEHQRHLTYAAFFGETFTAQELYTAANIPVEAGLDLLNLALSLRILEVHALEKDELYAFIYPIFRRLLTASLQPERWPEFAGRAAAAMSQHRREYHRQHSASLLAVRFSEARQPVEALRWQLQAVSNALSIQLEQACHESLSQLHHLLVYWVEQGASPILHQALPGLFLERRSAAPTRWDIAAEQLLWTGILYSLQMQPIAQHQSHQAQHAWRSFLQEQAQIDTNQLPLLYKRLQPLLKFARLDFVSPR